ncbi:MAG: hypothetical protein GTO41_20250 [Burkholderiales bacterium]|nr:hypothetical protein [Burkholderiales bacterium]
MPENFLIGAGTILDQQQVRQCIGAGADYLVSRCVAKGLGKPAHDNGRALLISRLCFFF